MRKRTVVAASVFVLLGFMLLEVFPQEVHFYPDVFRELKHDVSPPLKDLPPRPSQPGQHATPLRPTHGRKNGSNTPDPVVQTSVSPLVATTQGLNFLGVGVGLAGYSDCCAPPDTNGAVGATQFVQWVNLDFAVFDKTTGALKYGPTAGNTSGNPTDVRGPPGDGEVVRAVRRRRPHRRRCAPDRLRHH